SILVIDDNLNVDLSVSFPGGQNGATAFLIILKNIFRNQYKHSIPSTLDTTEGIASFFELKLTRESIDDPILDHEYIKISVAETTRTFLEEEADRIIEKITGHLNDPLIDSTNEIKDDGWGILEMKICAAYLIGVSMHMISTSDEKRMYSSGKTYFTQNCRNIPFPWIKLSKTLVDTRAKKYQLQYEFYLLKEKFCTVFLDEATFEQWSHSKKCLNNNGVFFEKKLENTTSMDFNSHSRILVGAQHLNPAKYNFKSIQKPFYPLSLKKLDLLTINHFKEQLTEQWYQSFLRSIQQEEGKPVIKGWKTIDQDSELKGNKQLALLDDHSCHFNKRLEYENATDVLKFYRSFGYYERLDNGTSLSGIDIKNIGSDKMLKWELLETMNTNIVIFDERLQDLLCSTLAPGINSEDTPVYLNEMFALKGVHVPAKAEYDLHQFFYGKENDPQNSKTRNIEDLIRLVKRWIKQYNCKYIIIHFSGFETLVNNSREIIDQLRSTEAIEEHPKYSSSDINLCYRYLLQKTRVDQEGRYIVFTSGKGNPATLPSHCFFIAFNNIESAIKKRVKFTLVKLLTAVRITN
ncbi:MAG: hypothetical protein AAF985_13555, partial [Bacteroidota bacterium]